jgi:putative protein-disulfide isomerase
MHWSQQIAITSLMVISLQAQTQTKENESKMKPKLIYIMDPHCGWCYGNSHNITELYTQYNGKVIFELLVGGMWTGNNAPQGGPELEQFINTHSPRMEASTGAFVSKDYYKLAKDSSYIFSSLEPAAAIVWVKELAPEETFMFAEAVQKASFAEGKRLDKTETYIPILDELRLDAHTFQQEWLSEANIRNTLEEIRIARLWASGFPTLLLQDKSGVRSLASGYFNLEEMTQTIDKIVH